jgi:hypothetical protein
MADAVEVTADDVVVVAAAPAAATAVLFDSAANDADIPLRISNNAKLVDRSFFIESQILSLLIDLLYRFFVIKFSDSRVSIYILLFE